MIVRGGGGEGIDFLMFLKNLTVYLTLIAPLLPSHCGFSSVLGHGVSSLVKSRVFLSMIVQQPVVILELSQEGVSARPSTPPSWLILQDLVIFK